MLSKWFIFVYKIWVDYISLNLRKNRLSERNFTLLTVVDKLLWNQLVNISVFHLLDDKILLFFVNVLVRLQLRSVTTSVLSL